MCFYKPPWTCILLVTNIYAAYLTVCWLVLMENTVQLSLDTHQTLPMLMPAAAKCGLQLLLSLLLIAVNLIFLVCCHFAMARFCNHLDCCLLLMMPAPLLDCEIQFLLLPSLSQCLCSHSCHCSSPSLPADGYLNILYDDIVILYATAFLLLSQLVVWWF